MFARMISLITLPAKRSELCEVIEYQIAPLVRCQTGFIDYLTLISDEEPRVVVAISLWKKREHAEVFARDLAPMVLHSLQPLLQAEPRVRTFDCFSIHPKYFEASGF
jgi:hypothetical protein